MVWVLIAGFAVPLLFAEEHHLPERSFSQMKASDKRIQARHLIVPLTAPSVRISTLDDHQLVFSHSPPQVEGKPNQPITVQLAGQNIDEDISALDQFSKPRCNWQQILRAIKPHLGTLESIWFIGSNGDLDSKPIPAQDLSLEEQSAGGSAAFLMHAADFVRPYLGKNVQVFRCYSDSGNLKFHDYHTVEQMILAVIRNIKAKFSVPNEASIVVDTTGGLKLISIVGAAITFRRQAIFQYVDTTDSNQVYAYDVSFEAKPETGL